MSEEKKVVIVTEASGREMRYDADSWDRLDEHAIDIERSSREDDPVVAHYAAGAWLSVREVSATMPDSTARALRLAKTALETIAGTVLEKTDARCHVVGIARDAIEEIFAETEL